MKYSLRSLMIFVHQELQKLGAQLSRPPLPEAGRGVGGEGHS